MMKSTFVLCAVIGAALVLGGCANQNGSNKTTTKTSRLPPEAGVSGTGGSGGGGGPAGMPKSRP